MAYEFYCGDCLEVLRGMPADSVDLVFGSPPYEAQRTYGIGFALTGQAWVDWMVQVFSECQRVCTGLVAFVVDGPTRKFRWSSTPSLLEADLHRAGFNLRKPPIFHRSGISGGGGPDWLRNDYERIVCTTRAGRLPWADITACGHPPKYAPGGEMSYRLADGERRNQWGGGAKSGRSRRANGDRRPEGSPSHVLSTRKIFAQGKTPPKKSGAHDDELQTYTPPVLANPGNVIHCPVGGGLMGGDVYCSQNEAPFPEKLAQFFVLSFCRPAGVALDPFCGSGTTVAVAHRYGRRGIGIDIRQQMIELSRQRCENETPFLDGIT